MAHARNRSLGHNCAFHVYSLDNAVKLRILYHLGGHVLRVVFDLFFYLANNSLANSVLLFDTRDYPALESFTDVLGLVINLFEQSQRINPECVASKVKVDSFSVYHLLCLFIILSNKLLRHQLCHTRLDIGNNLIKHRALRLSVLTFPECLNRLFIQSRAQRN